MPMAAFIGRISLLLSMTIRVGIQSFFDGLDEDFTSILTLMSTQWDSLADSEKKVVFRSFAITD